MKRFVLAALAVGALALGAPAAQATHTYEGGCGFDSVTDPSEQVAQPDVFTGVMYAAVVVTSPAGAHVDVTCEIRVNNIVKDSFSTSGEGAAFGADQAQFLATDADTVTMCDVVTVNGHTTTDCGAATTTQIPPQEVIDAIDALFTILNDQVLIPIVDPAICPGLAAIGATGIVNVPGVLVIAPDGDITLLDGSFYGCPPY